VRATAIIQARVGSSRLPGKVLSQLACGMSVLEYTIARCRLSRRLVDVGVATTERSDDDEVVRMAERLGVPVHRGSEHDVLDRYVRAAQCFGADPVVRITADSPLVDPANIDEVIDNFEASPADYVGVDGYPLGLGIAECASAAALQRARALTRSDEPRYREHVTTYLICHPEQFTVRILIADEKLRRPELRLTIDEPPDLVVTRRVAEHFAPRIAYSIAEIIAFLDTHPEVVAINAHVRQRSY
jgi:spore coat polysaccharide biosynthesis protein SpsF